MRKDGGIQALSEETVMTTATIRTSYLIDSDTRPSSEQLAM